MPDHLVEIVCPLLTMAGIYADYLHPNPRGIMANEQLEPFSGPAWLTYVLAAMLLVVTYAVAENAADNAHLASAWETIRLAALAAVLGLFACWTLVDPHDRAARIPLASDWVAKKLRSHEERVQRRARSIGLPIATAVCVIEMGHYVSTVLVG